MTVTLRLETGEVLATGLARDPRQNIEDEERRRDPEAYDRRKSEMARLRARGVRFNIT